MATDFLSVKDIAAELGYPRTTVSGVLARKFEADQRILLVSGRKLVPRDMLSDIKSVLEDGGHLPLETK